MALPRFLKQSRTFGEAYFTFQKQILCIIISKLSKNKQKSMCDDEKILRFLSTGHRILPSCSYNICREHFEQITAHCNIFVLTDTVALFTNRAQFFQI